MFSKNMRINSQIPKISAVQNKTPSFQSNFFSGEKYDKFIRESKLKDSDLFFVDMIGYAKDEWWARKMLYFRDILCDLIKKKTDFYDLMDFIEENLYEVANKGNVAKYRWGRKRGASKEFFLTPFDRGMEYFLKYKLKSKFHKIITGENQFSPKSNKKFSEAQVVQIRNIINAIKITYGGNPEVSNPNYDLAKQEYDKLISIKNPSLRQINKSIATIHWLIAQSTPYIRGSDSAASLLTKALYKANNVEIYPLKEGKSFDFEAFYSNLNSFIRKYPKMFKYKPRKISG